MILVPEFGRIPEGYQISIELTNQGFRARQLCAAICALWWGWSFSEFAHYLTYKCPCAWVAEKKEAP